MRDWLESPWVHWPVMAALALIASAAGRRAFHAWQLAEAAADGEAVPLMAAAAPTPSAPSAVRLRVLFIGNSLSAPLPALLHAMGDRAGMPIVAEGETPGGRTLAEHAATPHILQRIQQSSWDVVVLQEQSELPSFSEATRMRDMYPAGLSLAHAVSVAGARAWLYGMYAHEHGDRDNLPADTYRDMQSRLDKGIEVLAGLTQLRVVPAGAAFSEALDWEPPPQLWADGRHASASGNLLVCSVFFATLLGIDPTGVPFDAGVPSELARRLRALAARTVASRLGLTLAQPSHGAVRSM
ncbi:MAG TPA: hypothetical protein VGI70_02500 [Polyangiales bacterium]